MAAELVEHVFESSTADAESQAIVEALTRRGQSLSSYNRTFRVYGIARTSRLTISTVATSSAVSGHLECASFLSQSIDSDQRWSELLSDPSGFDILEQMAAEALVEDDAGLTLDLDDLLS